VRLLSFLSYGDAETGEHRLVFHKFICGLDLETALPAAVPVSLEEKQACEELLQAVINHWKALRNTSPDGLREAFLQREGKLSVLDQGYKLQLENRTEDILLSRLPWGVGMIKLPWMKKMLSVDWV
jgi:hypothetical protein